MFGFDEILCLEQGEPFCALSPEHASGALPFETLFETLMFMN